MSRIKILKTGTVPRHAAVPMAASTADAGDEELLPPTLVVWAVRAATLGALGLLVGYLTYMIVSDTVPAQFDIRPDFAELEARDGAFVLPVDVVNDSTEAVTEVVVVATLDAPGEADDEQISYTVALMGEGERATAELRFQTRPTDANTDFRVTSYQSP